MDKSLPIGIFDSGMGGLSVLKEAIKTRPNENFVYYGDFFNAPYGVKSKSKVKELVFDVCDFLIDKKVKAIVVACNTATSVAIEDLRVKYEIPIIGMEPALRPAVSNKSNQNVLVMATELTLKEKKFDLLSDQYSKDNNIIKLPCPGLVTLVESGLIVNKELAIEELRKCLNGINLNKLDSIVLGCTHFIFYKDYIKSIVPNNVEIIDGNSGTVKNLYNILKDKDLLNNEIPHDTKIEFYNSCPEDDNKILLTEQLFELV